MCKHASSRVLAASTCLADSSHCGPVSLWKELRDLWHFQLFKHFVTVDHLTVRSGRRKLTSMPQAPGSFEDSFESSLFDNERSERIIMKDVRRPRCPDRRLKPTDSVSAAMSFIPITFVIRKLSCYVHLVRQVSLTTPSIPTLSGDSH